MTTLTQIKDLESHCSVHLDTQASEVFEKVDQWPDGPAYSLRVDEHGNPWAEIVTSDNLPFEPTEDQRNRINLIKHKLCRLYATAVESKGMSKVAKVHDATTFVSFTGRLFEYSEERIKALRVRFLGHTGLYSHHFAFGLKDEPPELIVSIEAEGDAMLALDDEEIGMITASYFLGKHLVPPNLLGREESHTRSEQSQIVDIEVQKSSDDEKFLIKLAKPGGEIQFRLSNDVADELVAMINESRSAEYPFYQHKKVGAGM